MTHAPSTKRRAASALYHQDPYAWAQEQVGLLRAGRLDEVDAENIAEEISDVGRNEYDKLESALRVLLTHMLKWDHQPERRSRSWEATIAVQRRQALRQLSDNPSLKSRRNEALKRAYEDARDLASGETGFDPEKFPESCPYDWKAIESRPFNLDPGGRSRPHQR